MATDPLIGKLFVSSDTQREPTYGQIRSRIAPGSYLVRFAMKVPASEPVFRNQQIVSLDGMRGWQFFDDPAQWRESVAAQDAGRSAEGGE
jgi:hypothetical protein